MRLITHHPIKLGMFSFKNDRCLIDLLHILRERGTGLSIELVDTEATEFMSTLYPQKLVVTGFESLGSIEIQDLNIRLEVFSGGQANLVVEENLKHSQLSRDSLIEYVDQTIRSQVCHDVMESALLAEITEHLSDHRYPNTVPKALELMFAYSQIVIAESDVEWQMLAPIRGATESVQIDSGHLSVDASFVCLYLDDVAKTDYFSEMLATVTVFTAMAYELQQQGLKVSRNILDDTVFVEDDYDELQKYMHWVDVCEQFQVELSQEDFLATRDEQQVAKVVADNWMYSNLCNRVGVVVSSLASHVRSIETKRSLRNQDRANLIFLAFTLISILSVSGDLLALYDIGDKILPTLRLAIVTATFTVVSIASFFYLRRH